MMPYKPLNHRPWCINISDFSAKMYGEFYVDSMMNSRAKYCQGVKVLPLSTERSSTHRSGRGELANLMRT